MSGGPANAWLVAAGLLFSVFLVVKLIRPTGREGAFAEARRRIADAKRRARERAAPASVRAAAMREAARVALDELGRPSLAASYARRAERLDPSDADAVGLTALSLRRASRFHALERFLWRRLAADPGSAGPAYERTYSELLRLYEGPLRRPEVAAALKRLRGGAGSGPDAAD